jgi:polyribonucleotide nucleotidyltransferase
MTTVQTTTETELKPFSFNYGDYPVTLEPYDWAPQAHSSVMITMGGTKLLVVLCVGKQSNPDIDFTALTVNYTEKFYSVGKIPGSYFKREGRPTEHEILICRLIDRSFRPLFPAHFHDEMHFTVQLLAFDKKNSPDVGTLAILAASATMAIAGMPFNGTVAAAHVGKVNGELVLNPSYEAAESAELRLVVAGTENGFHMVEAGADEISEKDMLSALAFAQEAMGGFIKSMHEFAKSVPNKTWDFDGKTPWSEAQYKTVEKHINKDLEQAYTYEEKTKRSEALAAMRAKVLADLTSDELTARMIEGILYKVSKKHVRQKMVQTKKRIDGRNFDTVRPIKTRMNPTGSHGGARFDRGETSALALVTLGGASDRKRLDDPTGLSDSAEFLLHYNFPPHCTGEARMPRGTSRREVGHGNLALKAITPVLPSDEEFPYVIRVVSEVLSSNGSSSMATVCASSLALMDAGVPIKSAVSGVAMGLVQEGDDYLVLTDILGDEDHLGDMDFKVAGTDKGITALQMDIKLDALPHAVLEKALEQAKAGREHIREKMNEALSEPRENLADNAPRIITIKINPEKIKNVIGKGGSTIKEITEKYDVSIDIEDSGIVKILSVDGALGEQAKEHIEGLTQDLIEGKIYEGKVAKIVDFGAFVDILPSGSQSGLLHISQIAEKRIENVSDELQEGQIIKVKVIEIDRQGRVRLSAKHLND